jgi:TldD protein
LGVEHADFRCERIRNAELKVRDGKLEGVLDRTEIGIAVRVVSNGAWGFASGMDLTPEKAAKVAELAVDVARVSRPLSNEGVALAAEPVYPNATWVSSYEVNPFDVPDTDKLELLAEWSTRLLGADGVDHVYAKVRAAQENKFYADLAGTVTNQQRVRIYPQVTAVSLDKASGSFETMRTLGPPIGRGWEYLTGGEWDWEAELALIPEVLAEKMQAPSLEPGTFDLVIDPSNLWLVIHESVGHATELDRALGYEAAYAGTSFATPDKLGTLRYGSSAMNITGDRVVEHGLATVGYDDEGVAAQSWDIIRDGVLVGYQLDRHMARLMQDGRSNGCAYADSPLHVALQRMPNVSLKPAPGGPSTLELISGVESGIYVVGDKSWSIDMQRYNFQFTGQRFYRIKNGRLAGQVRDVAYQGSTPDFWGSMEAVGGAATYALFGADLCGKAQPGQIAAASHGCPSALFRQVQVLNTAQMAVR